MHSRVEVRRAVLLLALLTAVGIAPTSQATAAGPGRGSSKPPKPTPVSAAPTASPSPAAPSPTPSAVPTPTPNPTSGPGVTPTSATSWSESFSTAADGAWSEGSRYGAWKLEFDGYGTVRPAAADGDRVLELWPNVQPQAGSTTTAALVSSAATTTGDVRVSARMRTLSQNAPVRTAPSPANPWEVAWLYWNYSAAPGVGDQGTGAPTSVVRKGYYVALKPNGWELGKLDQSTFRGGQRFLASGSMPAFAVGTTWRDVTVEQRGATLRVSVGGTVLTTFTDGPGSTGSPAWGTPGEAVFDAGAVALYSEDARVQFDDVTVTGRTG